MKDPSHETLDNAASEVARHVHECHPAGHAAALLESLAAEVHVTGADGAPIATSREQLADPAVARQAGLLTDETRVLAVRDDHLALMDWNMSQGAGAADRWFALIELDQSRRIHRLTLYAWEVQSLRRATDQLEARWKETTQPDEADLLMSDAVHAWRHGDQAMLDRLLHPDFRVVDHRSFGWGEFDRSAFIALFDGDPKRVVVEITGRTLGGTVDGRAFQLSAWGCADGGLIEALVGHFIGVFRDGQVLRTDGYDPRDPAETLELLRALVDELGARP